MTSTPEARAAIVQALWPAGAKGSVWAVFDAARDPQVYRELLESRLEFRCLYSGTLPRLLEMNAPQLVELFPTSRLVQRWLEHGWGRAWGVLLRIEDPSNLRHHLRKFLKVRDEQGRSLIFRWYDPRVLRAYLPSCTEDELRTVFGPIDAWYAESGADGGLLRFRLARGALVREALVDATPAPSPRSTAAAPP